MIRGKAYIFFGAGALITLAAFASYKVAPAVEYSSGNTTAIEAEIHVKKTVHIETPESVRAVYMTSCYAATPTLRSKLVKLTDETEINSIIIDIKDYSGTISFHTGVPSIDSIAASSKSGCIVSDMEEFIADLHEKGIYVIGRVTVFQDPLYSRLYPELAVKRKTDGAVWKDRKGLSFIDVGAKEYWEYIVNISKASEKIGFDEINFDYIRYPSDGDMTNISFSHSGSTLKREMLRQFFEYLDNELLDTKLKTSADLFGMVTTNTDDLGIGQVLENALPYFDYIAPMVYPSHYPQHFNGWPDPNKVPYELIKYVMGSAVKRTDDFASTSRANLNSTTTPHLPERNLERISRDQLRPWLQDNDYPVVYTAAMVRAQIEATYDAGLTSWMLWDPSNKYTREALFTE
jgi:hypothetical protein